MEVGYLRQLAEYWRMSLTTGGSRALNEFPQFTAEIDGVPIDPSTIVAFTGALPLVIIHGWPGSMTNSTRSSGHDGAREHGARRMMCASPSLPAFGFSGQPKERGWSSGRSRAIAKLMARLGYTCGSKAAIGRGHRCAGWPPTMASTASAGTVIFLCRSHPAKSRCAASHRRKSSGCGFVPPSSRTSGPTARFRARDRRRRVTP